MKIETNKGENLERLAAEQRVLLVFLRHFGCTFCRETMADLANDRAAIEASGTKIVIVHMVDSEMASQMLSVYGLDDLSHISDINKELYNRFGIQKADFRAFFGLKNWWRAFVAGILKGHLVGKPAGDPFQMPGVVLFHKQRIINNFVYKYISDRPDFVKLTQLG
jgi:hypothetical protein